MNVKEIMKEVVQEAGKAAARQLEKLEVKGPRYSIYNTDLFGNKIGETVGTLLDNCGGAYLIIGGKERFVNVIKKQYSNEGSSRYAGDGWWMNKSVYKGYNLYISHSLSGRQEMSVDEEAMKAAKEVLNKYGIKVSIKSYID